METLHELTRDVSAAATLESLVCGKGIPKVPRQRTRRRLALGRSVQRQSVPFDTNERVADVVKTCRDERKRRVDEEPANALDNAALTKYARFTDGMALKPYEPFLHYVPRLVNIVRHTPFLNSSSASAIARASLAPTLMSMRSSTTAPMGMREHKKTNTPKLTMAVYMCYPRLLCAQVTLAEAIPVAGSGVTLPLNLSMIAARCNGAYFAPKRFAAVQLAYTNPRCRILFFHTGRVVGTGCSGAMAARLAISRAQRQLAEEAGVHVHIRNFSVINQVGAISLRATLNCEGFANDHRSTSHYDAESFVGLAWRPENESSCCEIYSTGRANLPGSRTERDLLASFSRMLPELLRHSSASRLLSLIPEELQRVHRPQSGEPVAVMHGQPLVATPAPVAAAAAAAASEEEEDEDESDMEFGDGDGASDVEDVDDAMLAGRSGDPRWLAMTDRRGIYVWCEISVAIQVPAGR